MKSSESEIVNNYRLFDLSRIENQERGQCLTENSLEVRKL